MKLSYETGRKEKNLIDLEYVHFENLSEVFVRRIFPTRAVSDKIE